jgi:methylated-DNA-[protein]-cysteine S-methyltransferase
MTDKQWKMESPLGPLFLVASRAGLKGVFWEKQRAEVLRSLGEESPEARHLARAVEQLGEYFAGKRREFALPLDVDGTPFQRKVWAHLNRIPYGKTSSYGELAHKVGAAKAARAVCTANGKNPLCIIVPCHRVIASRGGLGGYSGGLERKSFLLRLEGGA